MREPTGLDRLHSAARDGARTVAGIVDELFGQGVVALVCFGKALTDRFDAQRDTIATVLVVDAIDLETLRTLARRGPRLGAMRVSAPLVMTPEYVRGSLDTFPLELLEIQQKHVTLFGAECFTELPLQPEHVRLQCEREFKRLLIQLRQNLLKAADQEFVLSEVQHAVGDDAVRALRGVLWIQGQRDARDRDEVVVAAAGLTGRSLVGLRHAVDADYEPGWEDFTALYADLAALSEWADHNVGATT